MENELVQEIVSLRQRLILDFTRLKDYKQNKNALMKEHDHAMSLHGIIVEIDRILEGKVNFD